MAGQEQPKKMTVEDVLRICVRQLGAVSVPVAMYDSVGAPVRNVMHNLEECLRAMEWERGAAARQDPAGQDAPEIPAAAWTENRPEAEQLPELEEEEDDSAYIRQTGRIVPPRNN